MENISRDLSGNSKIIGRKSSSKRQKQWAILFVGESGKRALFHLTRPVLFAMIGGVTIILTFLILSTASNKILRVENRRLKNELKLVMADLKAANKARNEALDRLIVLEQEIKETRKRLDPVTEVVPLSKSPKSDRLGQKILTTKVSVEDLEIIPEPIRHSIRFQYSLRNIDPENKRISGYTFLILKPKEDSIKPTIIYPRTPLKDGKPTIIKKGRYFSIARFLTIKGKFSNIGSIDGFKTATVYVYSVDGTILEERSYDIKKVLKY